MLHTNKTRVILADRDGTGLLSVVYVILCKRRICVVMLSDGGNDSVTPGCHCFCGAVRAEILRDGMIGLFRCRLPVPAFVGRAEEPGLNYSHANAMHCYRSGDSSVGRASH